jgi:hypothetical protein
VIGRQTHLLEDRSSDLGVLGGSKLFGSRRAEGVVCQPIASRSNPFLGVLAVLLISLASVPAYAQIAAALGKPLPSPDLAPGTVTVRVVAGAPSVPVTGVDVTLTVNGTPREARTDSAGRANFPGLPPGAKVQAKTLDVDKQGGTHECDAGAICTSNEFTVPEEGGMRVLLTTKPWQAGGGGGAPFAGGGMPPPRQMSGEPRYDQGFEPGTITAIVTYNNLALADGKLKDSAPPVGVVVSLVGYQSDNKVVVTSLPTNASGEALFTGLDRTGNTVYFAMAQLPRKGAVDRLVSTAMQLGPEGGVKVILSSEKKDADAAVIDDLSRLSHQDPVMPEGKVRVLLSGVPQMATVNLVDAATGTVVSQAQPQAGPPDPTNMQPGANFEAKPDLPAGTFDLEVRGGPTGTDDPLANVTVKLRTENGQGSKEDAEFMTSDRATATTGDTGGLRISGVPTDTKWQAILTINGKDLVGPPFDLSKEGGKLNVAVHWEATGRPLVMFDYIPRANQVVYAETSMRDISYRSAPFQGVVGHGTTVEIGVLPRVMFKFHMGGVVEDAFLGVQGEFEIDNYSWSPYAGGPDGVVLPLPKGFKGAVLDKQDQQDIAIDAAEGFRIVRPLGPGRRTFRGGFSLPVENGNVKWAMDLPFGAWESNLNLLEFPGMSVQVPGGVQPEHGQTESGQNLIALPRISIEPKHAMVLSITGLPSAPAWKTWVPRVIGALVVALMVTGVVLALLARRRQSGVEDASRESRRAKLLDELVTLDKAGKDNKRREAVIGELESLWDE